MAQGGGLGVAGGTGAQPVPPQPLFHHDDINVQSLAGLTPHLQINPQVSALTTTNMINVHDSNSNIQLFNLV